MYCRRTNLHNIRGRIDYISNPARQEKILAYEQSFNKDDVNRLVKEQQEQFAKYNRGENNKCIEGQELIFPLKHEYIQNTEQAKDMAQALVKYFKSKYKVECCCSIQLANKGKNLHAHLILFDREKLEIPEKTPAKIATRTRYYDENWKRTTKAKAVHIQKKGDLIEPAKTRYFTDKKKEFYSKSFLQKMKEDLAKQLNYLKFDKRRHFATKHIGKHNPKKKFIDEYNKTVIIINQRLDKMEELKPDLFSQTTPKEMLCYRMREQKYKNLTIDILINEFNKIENTFLKPNIINDKEYNEYSTFVDKQLRIENQEQNQDKIEIQETVEEDDEEEEY